MNLLWHIWAISLCGYNKLLSKSIKYVALITLVVWPRRVLDNKNSDIEVHSSNLSFKLSLETTCTDPSLSWQLCWGLLIINSHLLIFLLERAAASKGKLITAYDIDANKCLKHFLSMLKKNNLLVIILV